MNISWSLIPIIEARGFIQSYLILYQEIANRKRQISSVSVPATDSSVVIGGLDPDESYSVSISASTNAGQGAFTSEVVVERKRLFYEYNFQMNVILLFRTRKFFVSIKSRTFHFMSRMDCK